MANVMAGMGNPQLRDPKTGLPEVVIRSFELAKMFITLYKQLRHDEIGRILGKQALRSGTSVGANIYEAQAAQTRRDFITKMSIAHKEAMESIFWVKLIQNTGLGRPDFLVSLLEQSDHMSRTLGSIITTAKQRLEKLKPSRQ